MARPLRVEFDGAWYHVMNRGAARRRIFRGPAHQAAFLHLLDEASRIFSFEVHAYCLMTNHYHLLVHTPVAGLARPMRHLDGIYAQRFNRSTGRDGPLFRGRYHAVLVEAEAHLCQVSRYVHLNPVLAGIAERPEDWHASSYRAYVGLARLPGWLHVEQTLGRFPGGDAFGYRQFVESGLDDPTQRFFTRQRVDPVLGSDSFRRRIAELVRTCGTANSPEVPDARRIVERPTLSRIAEVVCATFGVTMSELRRPGREEISTVARGAVAELGRNVGGLPIGTIAAWLGYSSHAAASKVLARMRARMEADLALRGQLEVARSSLAGGAIDRSGVKSRPDP